ncbi:thiol reductase thioredoxin [Sinorhizobium medicae]|uniref:thioredoxin family protein n=1 Tax=Sinorhizobium medicae TaxID=110321 RepID=UPI001294FF6D|nr:thioredoxin domain-containing protein [Sinorhizobium medicae]MQV98077.1 thiol reductase thioredoxin [Sinorhizobium medicae]
MKTTPNEHPTAILEVDASNFSEEVLKSADPVVVIFTAEMCEPCEGIETDLEEVATELAGKVKIVKLNDNENLELAAKFGVYDFPTLAIFKGGEVVVADIDYDDEPGSLGSSISKALASLRT